jgi:hypothetical protein
MIATTPLPGIPPEAADKGGVRRESASMVSSGAPEDSIGRMNDEAYQICGLRKEGGAYGAVQKT